LPAPGEITGREFSAGDRNFDDEGTDIVVVIRGYFDDSADNKRQRFAAVGGLVGAPVQWLEFERNWNVATYELPGPFHSVDCDCNPPRGVFAGWDKRKADSFMKKLVGIIDKTRLLGLGMVVPIAEYHEVFPGSAEDAPYFLALRHAIVNMARIGADLARTYPEAIGVKMWHEQSRDTSAEAFRIYQELQQISEWPDAKYLQGFAVGSKSLVPLQGADLMAREMFKHADNMGVRPTRRPVLALKNRTSFHLWDRKCLEYLKANGGPTNLRTLTEWGYKRPPEIPVMTNLYRDAFDRRVQNGS
jgi:hypothetical protein